MHPLSNSQWGFQPGKSTVTALLAIVDNWLRMLDEGREIGAVFFDLQKAFDSVPHNLLMQQTGLNINILALLPGSRWWWLMDQAHDHQTRMLYLGYPKDPFWALFFS